MRRTVVSFFLVLLLAITLIPSFAFNVPLVKAQSQIGYATPPSQRDSMNWTRFWSKINQNSAWDLEYNNQGQTWVSIKSDLQVIKDYVGNESCKITLNFTASQAADYRLTFGINLDVKGYIHKEGSWNYTLQFSDYSVNFDWSDVRDIPNLQISHGIKDVADERWFWFRIRRDDIPQGAKVSIDPSISYVEEIQSFNISEYPPTWKPFGIEDSYGVPANSVVEIVLANPFDDEEFLMGVREIGSGLDRTLELHEAEDGGETTARFLVNVDENGDIDLYEGYSSSGLAHGYIVGYWEDITFTETWIDLNVVKADESTWVDRNLFTGDPSIPKGSVCLASLVNRAVGNEYEVGVRTDGSGLARISDIHEAEGGGVNVASMFVNTSVADGIIEIWCEDEATDCSVIIQGYFGSDMDFAELMTSKDQTSGGTWEEFDLTGDLDEDGRVIDFLLTNNNPNAEHYIGARIEGSSSNRRIQEHEAEGGGVTGFGISVKSDASGIVELYCDNANFDTFYLTGYFIFTTEEGTTENVYGSISSSVSVVGGKFVGYSTYCDVAPLLTIGTQVSYNIDKYAYANISLTVSIASGRSIEIMKYHSVSPQYSLFSTDLWSFSREGAVYELMNVDGWLQTLVGLEMYGDVQPLIVVDSSLEFAVVKYGDMEIVCQVTTSKTATLNLYLSVSPLFVIIGNYSEEAETIENIYVVVGQILGVDDYVLYVFESSGDVTQSIAIATSKSVSVTQLMEILLQMGLDHVSFKDLVKSIVVNQDLTIDSLTLTDLMRIGVINEDFTVDGLSLKELSRFGLINENAQVNSVNFKVLEKLGLINKLFTVNGDYSAFADLVLFGVINLDLTITDEMLTSFAEVGLINKQFVIDGLTLNGLVRDGIINEVLAIDGITLEDLIMSGLINLDLIVNDIVLKLLTRLGAINEVIVIDGEHYTLRTILAFGAINENLVINSITFEQLVRYGVINENLNVDGLSLQQMLVYLSVNKLLSVNVLTLKQLIEYGVISENYVIGSYTLKDFLRYGLIDENFVINGHYSTFAGLLIYGSVNLQFAIDQSTYKTLERLGVINEQFNINSITLEQFIRYLSVDLQFGVDSLTLQELLRYGDISETFSVGSITYEQLVRLGAISETYSINSQTLQEMQREGIIDETLTVNSVTLEDLIRFGVIDETYNIGGIPFEELIKAGIINETFLIDGELLTFEGLLFFGAINLDLTITDEMLIEFERMGLINEHLSINDLTLMGLIKEGVINEDFSVDGLTLKDLVKAGIINLDLTITDELYVELTRIGVIDETFNIDGLTLRDLIKAGIIDENFVLSNAKLVDLIRAGIVNEDLLVDGKKTMSFNLFVDVDQSFNIISTFESIWGTILNIFGQIASFLSVNLSTRGFPILQYIPVSRGLIFFAVIISGATGAIIFKYRKKQVDES